MIRDYFKMIRLHQWLKNFFVFAPLFFGLKLLNGELFIRSSIAFLAFSFVASSCYIFNDIMDIDYDRAHPIKRFRPLAAGRTSKRTAGLIGIILASMGFFISSMVSNNCLNVVVIYGIINIAYSFKLKHIALLDIFCIAVGFVLRLFMGSYAIGVQLTHWIIIMTFLLAIFLAFTKRRDDVLLFLGGKDVRTAIEDYNLKLIDTCLAITAAIIIVAYIMYTISLSVTTFFHTNYLFFTSVFVFLGIIRYLQLIYVFEKSTSPTENLIRDTFLQLIILGWILAFIIIIYKK